MRLACVRPQEQIQAVVDAQLLGPLINLLSTAEFDIKKEAAWAISNATSGGTAEQIRLMVQYGCIKPLCDLLTVNDARIVTVALEGLENILKVRRAQQGGAGARSQARCGARGAGQPQERSRALVRAGRQGAWGARHRPGGGRTGRAGPVGARGPVARRARDGGG